MTNSDNQKVHILRPGVGFDDIELNRLTLADLKEKFGDKFKTDTFYLHPIICPSSLDSNVQDKKEIYSFRLFYDSLGISFYFKPDSNQITAIRVEKPFIAKTDKGIFLNKSTFREIVKTYGNTPWEFIGDYIAKEHNGVRFYRQFYQGMAVSDTILNLYLDSTVTEITISKINHDKSTRH
jgi:hypothetical protein